MIATPAWPPKSTPRLFVEQDLAEGQGVMVEGNAAHYLGKVMRKGVGDPVLLFNGRDGEWLATIAEAGKKRLALALDRQTKEQEMTPDVTLAFAPIKKGRIEFLVEKAVELGADRLQPVIMNRSVVDKINLDKMRAYIVEAAEQCGRTSVAEIAEPMKLDAFLKVREPSVPLYFCDEEGGTPAPEAYGPPPATILVGPEGGFTDEERAAIRAAPGATAISLGPRILRAETASLAALATYMARTDWK
ncbi:16S rRNA (uracil(1498)-N(3))-methyltransferase [Sphingomicrobium clamense]|uniref:Ribosomal RNA small subunit methyltransferase E n=1 Tax=Sphingomicrobium clamense TaxID=2851013 RepID=A0ABS6V459_9SPHN|nr:16S rRNA (uracil(1498)-N(3))-methyltransferase [Sphingomicrobium sp. B8]MBW0144333.1 16S rRNA (uracil(1498)-N(3))-methyltransferase [Sphingomicrobium sp. B8]